jgi:LysR family hydrogen peroxide-inducible transcriptional activator
MLNSLSLAGLSLRDLEYVEAVARLKHFGRAAECCNVSQPALSGQVRKLEAHLRVTIFERGNRHVALTPQGAALLIHIERILDEARNLLSFSRQGREISGTLHLGSIETLGPYYLPGMLQLLRRELPAISLRLTETRTSMLVERLRHGALDLVLAAGLVEAAGLVQMPLFFEPFVLALPRGHTLGSLPRIKLDSLPLNDLLLLEEGHCLRSQALALCGGAPMATRHATSLETLWHMIVAGEGYSLLPALALKSRPDLAGLVTCRKLGDKNAGRTISLVWRASDPREAQFRALAGLLVSHAPTETQVPQGKIVLG